MKKGVWVLVGIVLIIWGLMSVSGEEKTVSPQNCPRIFISNCGASIEKSDSCIICINNDACDDGNPCNGEEKCIYDLNYEPDEIDEPDERGCVRRIYEPDWTEEIIDPNLEANGCDCISIEDELLSNMNFFSRFSFNKFKNIFVATGKSVFISKEINSENLIENKITGLAIREGESSKIYNNLDEEIHGYLKAVLKGKRSDGIWIVLKEIIFSEEVIIPANGYLDIGTGFDSMGNKILEGWNERNVLAPEIAEDEFGSGALFSEGILEGENGYSVEVELRTDKPPLELSVDSDAQPLDNCDKIEQEGCWYMKVDKNGCEKLQKIKKDCECKSFAKHCSLDRKKVIIDYEDETEEKEIPCKPCEICFESKTDAACAPINNNLEDSCFNFPEKPLQEEIPTLRNTNCLDSLSAIIDFYDELRSRLREIRSRLLAEKKLIEEVKESAGWFECFTEAVTCDNPYELQIKSVQQKIDNINLALDAANVEYILQKDVINPETGQFQLSEADIDKIVDSINTMRNTIHTMNRFDSQENDKYKQHQEAISVARDLAVDTIFMVGGFGASALASKLGQRVAVRGFAALIKEGAIVGMTYGYSTSLVRNADYVEAGMIGVEEASYNVAIDTAFGGGCGVCVSCGVGVARPVVGVIGQKANEILKRCGKCNPELNRCISNCPTSGPLKSIWGMTREQIENLGIKTRKYYTVVNDKDLNRLQQGGTPWKTDPAKAHLGEGLYSFDNLADAEKYRSLLESHGAKDLKILEIQFEESTINNLNKIDLGCLDDATRTNWLDEHSTLFSDNPSTVTPPGFDYIIRPGGNFVEHYFPPEIFNQGSVTGVMPR